MLWMNMSRRVNKNWNGIWNTVCINGRDFGGYNSHFHCQDGTKLLVNPPHAPYNCWRLERVGEVILVLLYTSPGWWNVQSMWDICFACQLIIWMWLFMLLTFICPYICIVWFTGTFLCTSLILTLKTIPASSFIYVIIL